MAGKIILSEATGLPVEWQGDINNDGVDDSIEFRPDCRESDGVHAITSDSRYVVHVGGAPREEWGQFERLSGNEYIYRGGDPDVRFFAPDKSASFVPRQWVYDRVSREFEKIDGFVLEIWDLEPSGEIKVQFESGARRRLSEISSIGFLDGAFRMFRR